MARKTSIQKIEIPFYQCTKCERCKNNKRFYKSRSTANNRMKKCGYNPDNKGCLSCNNAFVYIFDRYCFYFCEHKEHPFHKINCIEHNLSKMEPVYNTENFPFEIIKKNISSYSFIKKEDAVNYYKTDIGTVIVYYKYIPDFEDVIRHCPNVGIYLFKYNDNYIFIHFEDKNSDDSLPF